MGVDRNCRIRGFYKSPWQDMKLEQILDFNHKPYKWYPRIEEYWRKVIDFNLEGAYPYKGLFIVEEYDSSDSGLHEVTVYEDSKGVFSASTDDHQEYRKLSGCVFNNDFIEVFYNRERNNFEIKVELYDSFR